MFTEQPHPGLPSPPLSTPLSASMIAFLQLHRWVNSCTRMSGVFPFTWCSQVPFMLMQIIDFILPHLIQAFFAALYIGLSVLRFSCLFLPSHSRSPGVPDANVLTSAFTYVLGIWSQVLVFTRQALYLLNHHAIHSVWSYLRRVIYQLSLQCLVKVSTEVVGPEIFFDGTFYC